MDVHSNFFNRIASGDVQAYEELFKDYYKFLCSYAFGFTKQKHIAEEIVEDFFVYLWNNRRKINITTSIRSYFIASIHNRCLNYLQREKPKFISSQDISNLVDFERNISNQLIDIEVPSLLTNELENVLSQAIEKLPPNCKEIFLLSRYSNLSYKEIAKKLGISINTVKTQMKIALSKLRELLKDYLAVLLLFILS